MGALADLDTPHLALGANTLKTRFLIKPDFYTEAREKTGGKNPGQSAASGHWGDRHQPH